MYRLKLKTSFCRQHLLVYRNYKKVDQISKIFRNKNFKTIIVVYNKYKFKKYLFKGLNFFNKKCLL